MGGSFRRSAIYFDINARSLALPPSPTVPIVGPNSPALQLEMGTWSTGNASRAGHLMRDCCTIPHIHNCKRMGGFGTVL